MSFVNDYLTYSFPRRNESSKLIIDDHLFFFRQQQNRLSATHHHTKIHLNQIFSKSFVYLYSHFLIHSLHEESIEPERMLRITQASALAQAFFSLLIVRSSNGYSSSHVGWITGASDHKTGHQTSPNIIDTTTIGSLSVPRVGVGTISWSSDSRKFGLRFHELVFSQSTFRFGLKFTCLLYFLQ